MSGLTFQMMPSEHQLTSADSEPGQRRCALNESAMRLTHKIARQHLRLPSSRQAYSDNHDSARVEQSSGLGDVELGRCQLCLRWKIVDSIHEGARLSPKARRARDDVCGSAHD
jgi:hypothetical protein